MKDEITIGEKYSPAMEIAEQDKADAYFEECVQHNMRISHNGRAEAERIEKVNLGYFAGYYNHETRERIERLFRCCHPIFGPVTGGVPTAEEALELGKKAVGKIT